MNIGLDYDDTITRDPEAFKKIVKIFREVGHKVYIVTMRSEHECDDIRKEWGDLVDSIVPCGLKAKRSKTWELGICIHIWIDDMPQSVCFDADPGLQKTEAELKELRTPEPSSTPSKENGGWVDMDIVNSYSNSL